MGRKRIRWAASVYGSCLQELRQVAENILKENVEGELRWLQDKRWENKQAVMVEDLVLYKVEQYSDWSSIRGKVAETSPSQGQYLGETATVADGES